MEQLFLLLLFIVGTAATLPLVYHGDRRFWTVVDSNGRTKVALHILNKPVNLVFPKDKTIAQLLSDMKLLSPSGNEKCQDTTNTLKFKLAFVGDEKYIRGEVKVETVPKGEVIMLLE
uniref:Uncharacterized protein n=1 Tax=Panagrolaimus davidi TaxID=227884 RepID=A0A914QX98_9BILA